MDITRVLIDTISYAYKSYTINPDTVNLDILENILELIDKKLEVARNSNDIDLRDILEDLINDIKKKSVDTPNNFAIKLSIALSSSNIMDDMDDIETSTQLANLIVGLNSNKDDIKKDVRVLNEKLTSMLAAHKLKKMANKINISLKKKAPDIDDIKNIQALLEENIEDIKKLSNGTINKNVYETIDFDDPSLYDKLSMLENQDSDILLFKLGWEKLNRMFQGGFRTKELALVGALSHNYKSGLSTSIFTSLAIFNKPVKRNNKPPMLLFISLEDTLAMVIDNIYTLLMNSYHPEVEVFVERVSFKDKVDYVKSKLEENGFKVKFAMMDSTTTTAIDVINVIDKYDEEFDVQYIVLDYAGKIRSLKTDMAGATGNDKLMIIRRLRVYINKTNKGLFTAWQLNGKAKDLERNGLKGLQFVEQVAGNGYYKDNSTLDTDIDAELSMHKFSKNRRWYLALRRGKHRMPTTVNDEDLSFILKFPLNKKHKIPLEVRPDMEPVAFSSMAEAEAGTEEGLSNIYG